MNSAQTYDASDSDHEQVEQVDEQVEQVDDKEIMALVKEHKVTYKTLVLMLFKQNSGLLRETLGQVQTKPKVIRPVKNPLTDDQKERAKRARYARKEYFDAYKQDHTEEEVALEVKRYNAEQRRNRLALKKRIAERKASDTDLDDPLGTPI